MKSNMIVRVHGFGAAACLWMLFCLPSPAQGRWFPPEPVQKILAAPVVLASHGAAAAEAIEAQTQPPSNVSSDFACLNASLTPRNLPAMIWFEYGTTPDCGFTTEKTTVSRGETIFSIMEHMPGLTPGTTYYYRVVARNQAGTTHGAVQAFTTPVRDTLAGAADERQTLGGCFVRALTF